MTIDWFTFVAQIINFLILLGLLWRFLYRPIVRAMDEREATITARMEEARRQRRQAEEGARAYRKKLADLDGRREELLAQAKEESERRRKELLAEARRQAEQMRAKWFGAVEQQIGSFLKDLRRRCGEQVCAAARRVLEDLAHADLERRVLAVFVERIRELSGSDSRQLREGAAASDGGVEVRSAFDISGEQRERISSAVAGQLGHGAEIRFTNSSDLICGIELRAGSWKLAWNVDAYLKGLEESVAAALADETEERDRSEGHNRQEAAQERTQED